MGIPEKMKVIPKRVLTYLWDSKYAGMLSRAQKQSGYSNLIGKLERKLRQEWEQQRKSGQEKELPSLEWIPFTFTQEFKKEQLLSLKGDILVFAREQGRRAKGSEKEIAYSFLENPQAVLLYGDEDVEEGSQRKNPWLKPDWSPDLFDGVFYLGALVAVRRSFLEDWCKKTQAEKNENIGWTLPSLVASWTKYAGGYEPQKNWEKPAIYHCKRVLFHLYAEEDYRDYFPEEQKHWEEGKESEVSEEPMTQIISVVIPSKDQVEVLERNLRGLLTLSKDVNLEVVVVDNGSGPEERRQIEKLRRECILQAMEEREKENRGTFTIRYLYEEGEFNFAKMCNMGAKEAEGDFLLFLNNDTLGITEGWVQQMARMAAKPYVGAVGAKLLYPQSQKIQHAGIVNLPMGPVHKLQFAEDDQVLYFGRNKYSVNVLAVTGACLMITKEKFWQVGGFFEGLPVAFNDVDLCFTLWEKGYFSVVMNQIGVYHFESLSRGGDDSQEKLLRLEKERGVLYQRHPKLEGKDPFYHPYLNHQALDTRIIPAPQEVLFSWEDKVQARVFKPVREPRIHQGLELRTERIAGQKCFGYSFMIGDNNACYEKKLLLREVEGEGTWQVSLPPRLRLDLQENMPDQKNVALCGFGVEIVGLPAGEYEMGVLAHQKVTGVTYCNWSPRRMTVGKDEKDNGNNGL